jgi:putative chitinase
MNRSYFFKRVRESLFSGKLSAKQAEGLTKILDYREKNWPKMSNDELAYLLATAKWETAHTMQPVEEGHPKTGSALRAYQRKLRYYPYYGRGLVQLTHDFNYERYGIKNNVAKALEWPMSLHVIFDGMIKGIFTGKKLADYIGDGRRDYVGARRIVNGADKAKQIALIAEGFREALVQANERPADAGVAKDEPQITGKSIAKSKTVWSQIAQWVAGGGAAALTALGEIPWQNALILAGTVIILAGGYIIYSRWQKSVNEGI